MGSWFPDLSKRIYLPELMDDPHCDPQKLVRSYQQLALINLAISRMRALLSRHILAEIVNRQQPAHVVEVGCGGGDVLLWLAKRARQQGLQMAFTGIDTDTRALDLARHRLASFPEVAVLQLPLQRLGELAQPADYLFCNHVLHHIPPSEVSHALKLMRDSTRIRLLVNDLHRSYFSYVSYSVLAAVLFHRSFTFHDGRLSIRKGFAPDELQQLARTAGFPETTAVGTAFPGRVVLVAPGLEEGL